MLSALTGLHIISLMFRFDFVCDSGLDWLQATKGSFLSDEIQTTGWHSEVKKEVILFTRYQFFSLP